MSRNWPDFAISLNYHEAWELRYWAARFEVTSELLMELAKTHHGNLSEIRNSIAAENPCKNLEIGYR